MGYFGNIAAGTAWTARPAASTSSVEVVADAELVLGHLSAYLDGGGGATDQLVTAELRDQAGTTVLATGETITVAAGAAAGWRELRFTDPPEVDPGTYSLTLAFGAGDAVRLRTSPVSIWGHYREAVALKGGEEYLAQLGWWSSQEALSTTPVVQGSATTASCGWHGSSWDDRQGAFALVRADGPLVDLVGQRAVVSLGDRQAYVFVVGESDVVEDISLARRAFAALAPLWTEELTVTVEVMS